MSLSIKSEFCCMYLSGNKFNLIKLMYLDFEGLSILNKKPWLMVYCQTLDSKLIFISAKCYNSNIFFYCYLSLNRKQIIFNIYIYVLISVIVYNKVILLNWLLFKLWMVSKILPGLAGVKCKLCDVSVSQSPFAILRNLFFRGWILIPCYYFSQKATMSLVLMLSVTHQLE